MEVPQARIALYEATIAFRDRPGVVQAVCGQPDQLPANGRRERWRSVCGNIIPSPRTVHAGAGGGRTELDLPPFSYYAASEFRS